MLRGTAEFIHFTRSYSVFPVFVDASSRSNFLIFFVRGYKDKRGPVGNEDIVSKFQRLTRRFTGALCMPTAAGNVTLDQLVRESNTVCGAQRTKPMRSTCILDKAATAVGAATIWDIILTRSRGCRSR